MVTVSALAGRPLDVELEMVRVFVGDVAAAAFHERHLGVDPAAAADQTAEEQRQQPHVGNDKASLLLRPRKADGGRAENVDGQNALSAANHQVPYTPNCTAGVP